MRRTFVHISDLHYRPDWPEEIGLVSARFVEDLARHVRDFPETYLVFSGDIVRAGESMEYDSSLISTFDQRLTDAGLPRNRRICIPGNHDVSRIALTPLRLLHEGATSLAVDERQFNDNLSQLSRTLFDPIFANYRSFEGAFAEYNCCTSGVSGTGWELDDGLGVFCLNTALCSLGGLESSGGKPISDKGRLLIDTRTLHSWLASTPSTTRVLVMHHPTEWLADWAANELENIVSRDFQLVLVGHIHQSDATFSTRGAGGTVQCVAPPLFTTKAGPLGYTYVTLDSDTSAIAIVYRQWSAKQNFVTGTSLAGNDAGRITFSTTNVEQPSALKTPPPNSRTDTLAVLQAEFDEAVTSYSSKRAIWVARDLANVPETSIDRVSAVMTSSDSLAKTLRACTIRAPQQFGLTCLGRYIALTHYDSSQSRSTVVMIDTPSTPTHPHGPTTRVDDRCKELGADRESVAGIILDQWRNDKHAHRVLRDLTKAFPGTPIMLLHGVDDAADIANGIGSEELADFESLYLWSLSRTRIRELVSAYLEDLTKLDDDRVTKKVIQDIDALNIHRTPLNCLMILKLLEQAFDDSPVNRTEMIGRVLYLLFYQFDKIPRYASRPDLKDCEYALGYVCEWLIRSSTSSFTKDEFYAKVNDYCTTQLLDLDREVLFAFLVSENILVRRGGMFEFRFSYWLYFFAAHRMHHSADFAAYILGDGRYAAFPEVIEFYTGIDRRRTDAVTILTSDLKRMNAAFSAALGSQ